MKTLIRLLVQALVDAPEQVSVDKVQGDHTTVFELRVAKSDLGKIIGKKGRNADAIRTIVNAVSAKERKRTLIEIIDDTEMTTTDNVQDQTRQKDGGWIRSHL